VAKENCLHKIDDLGRILLPKELRKELGWDIGDILSLCPVSGTVVMSLEKTEESEPDCNDN